MRARIHIEFIDMGIGSKPMSSVYQFLDDSEAAIGVPRRNVIDFYFTDTGLSIYFRVKKSAPLRINPTWFMNAFNRNYFLVYYRRGMYVISDGPYDDLLESRRPIITDDPSIMDGGLKEGEVVLFLPELPYRIPGSISVYSPDSISHRSHQDFDRAAELAGYDIRNLIVYGIITSGEQHIEDMNTETLFVDFDHMREQGIPIIRQGERFSDELTNMWNRE